MRDEGSAKRLPLEPAARIKDPIEAASPKFAAWRTARRVLSEQTGRDEAVGHWLTTYTDDLIALVLSVPSMATS
mgnify:FL=1